MRLFQIESGFRSGAYNMALDEALLETLRETPGAPTLIVRTYQWEEPTLSLGVNQAVRDVNFLLEFYGSKQHPVKALVRRPTGGRAILHGEDISFSFITNDPALLKLSLKDSYCFFTQFLKEALAATGVPVATSCEQNEKAYTRSPVCFDTQTPSDLLGAEGAKLAGSAQLRRNGGILQHGASFLKPYGVEGPAFSAALFESVARHYERPRLPEYPLPEIDARLKKLEADYCKGSSDILASASTTTGSHLEPASF